METTTEMPTLANIINSFLSVVVPAVTQFSPLTLACNQHSFVPVFFLHTKLIIGGRHLSLPQSDV